MFLARWLTSTSGALAWHWLHGHNRTPNLQEEPRLHRAVLTWKPSPRRECIPWEAFQQSCGLSPSNAVLEGHQCSHVPAGTTQATELVRACGLLPFLQAGSSSSSNYCCTVRCG